MFHTRKITHQVRKIKTINRWLGGVAYKSKRILLLVVLLILSTTNLPQLFADQIQQAGQIITTRGGRKYRIITLDQKSDPAQSYGSTQVSNIIQSQHSTQTGVLDSDLVVDSYSGSGACIRDIDMMQWTGLQMYTGDYLSGGLLSGSRSLDVTQWTGSWSGFDSQNMILLATTGIMMHDTLAHSMHYLAMRDCSWSSGMITYPTDAEYLSGLVMFTGQLHSLPPVFTGVQSWIYIASTGFVGGGISDNGKLPNPRQNTSTQQGFNTSSIITTSRLHGSAELPTSRNTEVQDDHTTRRIIRSKEEFKQLVDNDTIKAQRQSTKRARDTGAINKLQLTQDITYESDDARIKADIKADTVIFTAQGQELRSDTMVIRKPAVARAPKDSNPPTRNPVAQDVLEFGTPGDHLIFTQPVKLVVDSDQADGTLVNLSVKHGDDTTFTKQGLSTNPNTTCDLDGNTNIPAASATVQGGQITIYTCGASIFTFTYVGGANFANFVDNGSMSKTITVDSATVGSVYSIDKLKVIVDFHPIDSEDPTNFGTTNAYSNEVSMTIESPLGTTRTLLATNTYTNTAYADRVIVTFDDNAGSAPSGLPATGSFLPTQSLDAFDGENPLGDWIFTIADSVGQAGVTLHSVQLEINGIGCGDNVVDIGEQCDDGNTTDGDGCSNSCQIEDNWVCNGSPSSCACPNLQMTTTTSGVVNYAPYWGGFNANASVTNISPVTINSRCINVIGSNYSVTSNFSSVYSASGSDHVFCNAAWNGTLAPSASTTFGYQGTTGQPTGVQSPSHTSIQGETVIECLAVCGDGAIGTTEQCDDGNTTDGDGCSASCQFESGYSCNGEPSICNSTTIPSTNQAPIIQSNGGGGSATINLTTGQTFVTTVSATDSLENVIGVFGNTTMSGNTIKTLDYGYELCSPAISVSHRQRVNAEIQRVPRITAKGNTGFSVKVDNYNSTIGSITTTLDYVVMNTGARTFDNGLQVQAGTVTIPSTAVSCSSNANGGMSTKPTVTFSPSFPSVPSVLHNISSFNDSSWIVTNVNNGGTSRTTEPSTTSMGIVMQRSFNSCTHAAEEADYIAFEQGHWNFSGFVMDTQVSPDDISCCNANGYNLNYTSSFTTTPLTALVAQLGEDGGNGGYAMIHTNSPLATANMRVTIDEDGPGADRTHTNEPVSSVVFSTNTGVFTELNTLTYSISGVDAAHFTLNGSGQLSFVDPSDTLSANDSNADGVYKVIVSVCDSHCNSQCDTQDLDIVIPEAVVIEGDVCIEAPDSLVMSGVVGGVASVIEYEFDYFSVDDSKGDDDGYYTTLSLSSLAGPGGATIPTTAIERKGDPITVLSGTTNPNVEIATGMQSYGLANTVSTYIKRDAGANSGITGNYGSSLWLRVNVPAYQTPGTYTSTITYTLYEN